MYVASWVLASLAAEWITALAAAGLHTERAGERGCGSDRNHGLGAAHQRIGAHAMCCVDTTLAECDTTCVLTGRHRVRKMWSRDAVAAQQLLDREVDGRLCAPHEDRTAVATDTITGGGRMPMYINYG